VSCRCRSCAPHGVHPLACGVPFLDCMVSEGKSCRGRGRVKGLSYVRVTLGGEPWGPSVTRGQGPSLGIDVGRVKLRGPYRIDDGNCWPHDLGDGGSRFRPFARKGGGVWCHGLGAFWGNWHRPGGDDQGPRGSRDSKSGPHGCSDVGSWPHVLPMRVVWGRAP